MFILLIVGSVFGVCGIAVIIGCIAAQEVEAITFGLIFGGIFAIVGFSLVFAWFRSFKKKRTILKNGEKVWGTIVDYTDDTSLYINDIPALDIIVRCSYRGENKVCRLKTEQVKESKFPLGSSILLAIYQGQVAFFKNSVGGNGAGM